MSVVKKSKLLKVSSLFVGLFIIAMLMPATVWAQAASTDKTAVALYNEGLAALKAKDYKVGLESMEEALTKAKADANDKVIELAMKNGPVAAYYVGNDFLKEEQYDSAKVAFNRGIAMNDEYGSNHLGIARVLESEGAFMDALNAYVKYGEISKKEADEKRTEDAYKRAKNMVVKLYIDKDYASVAKVGEAYLASDLNSDVAYYVGKSHAELGAHSDAVAAYQKSIEASTKMSEAIDDKVHYAIGEAYEAQNMSSQAIEAYKKISDAKYKAQAEYRIGKLSGE